MTTAGEGRGRVRDGACVAMLALVGGAGSVGCAGPNCGDAKRNGASASLPACAQ